MSVVPLRLAALGGADVTVVRSGLRWLRDDGDRCRANEIVAWCNVRTTRADGGELPFADEARDLQVAFATRVAGRITRQGASSPGGFMDRLPELARWRAGEAFGQLEVAAGTPAGGDALRPMMVAGRRVVEAAEDRSGLLTGWHDRIRGWWGDGDATPSTLMGIGICEQAGMFRGDAAPFHEWFTASRGPAHVIYVPDHILAPAAAVIVEQARRTEAEAQAIRDDFSRSFAKSGPTPADWMLAGALMAALLRSPLTEPWDVMHAGGVVRGRGADAVVLSLNAEPQRQWRHKTLGYALPMHRYRVQEATPAVKAWLVRDFENVRHDADEVRRDYDALFPVLRSHGAKAILAMNSMSTSAYDDIVSYAPFDAPLGATIGSVRAKDLNLMLHDVARDHDVSIVDNDAIAAGLGAARHLTDGVHGSGTLHAELRADILRLLRERGVDGFAPPA